MEVEKRCPFDAFSRSHLKKAPSLSLSCLLVQRFAFRPTFSYPFFARVQFEMSFCFPVRLFSVLSVRFLFFHRDIKRGFQLRTCCFDASSPRFVGSFILVQSSSSRDLSSSFWQMLFVFVSRVSARDFTFLEFFFMSKSRVHAVDWSSIAIEFHSDASVSGTTFFFESWHFVTPARLIGLIDLQSYFIHSPSRLVPNSVRLVDF